MFPLVSPCTGSPQLMMPREMNNSSFSSEAPKAGWKYYIIIGDRAVDHDDYDLIYFTLIINLFVVNIPFWRDGEYIHQNPCQKV